MLTQRKLQNTNKTLFVLAHGLGGSGRTFWVVHMKNALLKTMVSIQRRLRESQSKSRVPDR